MKIFYSLVLLLFTQLSLSAQQSLNFWDNLDEVQIPVAKNVDYFAPPTKANFFKLDIDQLKYALKKAPMEFSTHVKAGMQISFPMPDGSTEVFLVEESPVLAPKLAAKFPNIKSYKGIGLNNKLLSIRFDYSPKGLHGSIHTLNGKVYIDPYNDSDDGYYMVYNTKNLERATGSYPDMACGYNGEDYIQTEELREEKMKALEAYRLTKDPVNMRVYRLALACTGEYGSTHGGTVEAVTASFNTAINRVNQIFEMEVSVRMQIIENNEQLIYLDPLGDPYTNSNNGGSLLGQNESVFFLSGISPDFYDVGHVFTNSCTDVGGIAGGTVCSDGKMRGVTCHFSNNIEFIAVEIMSHEIGHQFSCGHSWNHCPGNEGQLSGNNAYEPGSGSTIMSYAGACGSSNVQNGSDDYYNIGSLEDFISFSRLGFGNCGQPLMTSNNEPTITNNYIDGFTIPVFTPFELTMSATDPDGDVLSYCWEQHNAGLSVPLGVDQANSALFRSFPPSESTTRVFPRMQILRSNTTDINETLPKTTRDLNFTFTVRDNNPEGGGNVWEEVIFEATEDAGPFRVLHPNTSNDDLEIGAFEEIEWDVSNTDLAPVNCQNVDVYLSTDGGFTFPHLLLEGTKNDGSEFVIIPDVPVTNDARIKVKASDNIFFDISATDFPIMAPTTPGYFVYANPQEQEICLPAITSVEIITGSLLDYDEPIELSIVDGLPTEVVADFENNSLNPSESTILNLDFTDYLSEDPVNITLRAVSIDADTFFRTITVNTVSNNFEALSLQGPNDGDSGVNGSPSFVWETAIDANTYTFEIAKNPAFGPEDIVETASGISTGNYELLNLLNPSTLYYWRVIPENECGIGESSEINAFHTETLSCNNSLSDDTPIVISSSGTAELVSKINIFESGTISDINLRGVKGNHEYFSDLELILVGPEGTAVTIVKNDCLGQNHNFSFDIDQDALTEVTCPPVGVFRPFESIDVFNGKNTQGEWELRIKDNAGGAGGRISEWSIEFCSNVNLSNPQLIKNEVLPVQPGGSNKVDSEFLLAIDDINEAWQLEYTLVSLPRNGILQLKDGTALEVGDKFLQANINWFDIKYTHDDNQTNSDNFTFTINDGEGGWTGTHTFTIDIDPDNVVSNQELLQEDVFDIFPNPATDYLNINFKDQLNQESEIKLFDLSGQLLSTYQIDAGTKIFNIDLRNLPTSVYLLELSNQELLSTEKISIIR